jgi:hypothetical protein
MKSKMKSHTRRNTAEGFFKTQKDNQKLGYFVPVDQRRLVSIDEKSAHFKIGGEGKNK